MQIGGPAFYEAQKYLSQLSHSEVDWKSMCLGPRIEDMRWGTCSWVCRMECLFLDTSFQSRTRVSLSFLLKTDAFWLLAC